MLHTISLGLKLLGFSVGSALQPVAVLAVVAAGTSAGWITLPAPYSAIGSPAALATLAALFVLHLKGRNWHISPLLNLLRWPLVLTAGAFAFLSQAPAGNHAVPLMLGAGAAAFAHSIRSLLARFGSLVGDLPGVSQVARSILSGPLALLEAFLALGFVALSFVAPYLVPIVLVMLLFVSFRLSMAAAGKIGAILSDHYGPLVELVARRLGWLPPSTSTRRSPPPYAPAADHPFARQPASAPAPATAGRAERRDPLGATASSGDWIDRALGARRASTSDWSTPDDSYTSGV